MPHSHLSIKAPTIVLPQTTLLEMELPFHLLPRPLAQKGLYVVKVAVIHLLVRQIFHPEEDRLVCRMEEYIRSIDSPNKWCSRIFIRSKCQCSNRCHYTTF